MRSPTTSPDASRTDESAGLKKLAHRRTRGCRQLRRCAFSRADLLGTVATLFLLALLLVGSGSSTRTATEAVGCQDNSRRLIQAWTGFAADNSRFIPNDLGPQSWAWGVMGWGGGYPNATNTTMIQTRAFAPYVGPDTSIFRCPSDRFVDGRQRELGWRYRVRSYSMNYYVGNSILSPFVGGYRVFLKPSDLVSPSQTFVFIDEHPDSIDDTLFRVDPTARRDPVANVPASFHGRGATLSYADGRADLHRWQGTSVLLPVRFTYLTFLQTNDVDFVWLGQQASQPLP